MTRLVRSLDRRSNRSRGLSWCMAATVVPSIGITLAWPPLGAHHIGLLLGSVIAGGFIYWTGSNLFSGAYTSKQGVHRRDESPVRYWIHTIGIAAATILVILFWVCQVRAVAGVPPESSATSLLTTDPPPVPAIMTATTSAHSRSLAPGQA